MISRRQIYQSPAAEGIPCSGGYGPQNKDGLIEEQLNSKGYKRLFSEARLKQWREENVLPGTINFVPKQLHSTRAFSWQQKRYGGYC